MSMCDFPRLPAEMIPRVRKLVTMAKAGEVQAGEIVAQLTGPVVAKIIPLMLREGGSKLADAMPMLIPAIARKLPAMMGRQLFVAVADVGYFILSIGLPPKLIDFVPATFEEIKKARMPGVYIDLELITYFLEGGMMSALGMAGEDLIRVYGAKEMIRGNSGDSGGEGILDSIMPLMARYMTKEVMDSLHKPYEEVGEMVLSAFGV